MKPTWMRLRENPNLLKSYLMRETVIDAIRAHFKKNDFHEVETPQMVRAPGMEPYLEVFESELLDPQGFKHRTFLITSPEYAMKKLLVAGLHKIFQICKCFRNGEDLRSTTHNPEFTMIEWYRANSDYHDLMKDCEDMLCAIYDSIHGVNSGHARILKYQGQETVLDGPWERLSVVQAFDKYADVKENELTDNEAMKRIGREKGYQVEDDTTWEQMFHQIFLNEIEPHLGFAKPTILYDYPDTMAALSRKKKDDPRYAERFEFYIFGKELGNGFSELTDAAEQEKRLRAEWEERLKTSKKMYDIDEDFIFALETGMPESSGIAVGVDRLIMLFADVDTIQETLFFPANEMF